VAQDLASTVRLREVPLLPLRGQLVFPRMAVHLEVGRERSIRAVEEAMATDRLILLANQRDTRLDNPDPEDLYHFGTLAEIKQMNRLPSGGTIRVLVEGQSRAEVISFARHDQYYRVCVAEKEEAAVPSAETEALTRTILYQFEQYIKVSKGKIPSEALMAVAAIDEPGRLADMVIAQMPVKHEDKQQTLETVDVKERMELVCEIIGRELEILDLERKIGIRVRKQMERTQKEYYLREQLKAIHKELGDKEDRLSEVEEYRGKIKKAKMSTEAEEKALRELDRLEKMPPMAAEAVVVRTYLDWLCALPWAVETEDKLDIDLAQRILDEDHYGLDKVKDRILEFLAIRKLADKMRGPILCLVGPPGVGKTSLGRSVARALDRKFVRISLGGVRDEAEIRGHRRTYVGALPGRIIQGIRQAGSRNPVFVMDEVDKLSSDYRGDPSSALLEVLDPEQNGTFSDHYLEAAFDLSRVLFITTANNQHAIPRPLLDRMEVIQIEGYTDEEKVQIAARHLVLKVLKEHGLTDANVQFSENAIRTIIGEYTREAGVRNLEREIATVCRKIAREVVRGQKGTVRVNAANVGTYLGIARFREAVAEKVDEVGVATGMAVTDAGGDIMPIEVTVMKGKGDLILTGKLGEIMRESAQAGLSYIRSRAKALGVEEDFHTKYDLHIHVPEGAVPKDGPSAGITMATAMVSALSGRRVRRDVAMTGEITLRGKVLPVGGVKEKVLAAKRAGLRNVILPLDNRKNIEDIPANVRRKTRFILVEHMDEVLEAAMVDTPLASGPVLDRARAAGQEAAAGPGQDAPAHQLPVPPV
jgi:ATP-dependent Lon protease